MEFYNLFQVVVIKQVPESVVEVGVDLHKQVRFS